MIEGKHPTGGERHSILRSRFLWVLVLAVVVRIAFVAAFTDLHANYYWEYGEIAKNIIHGNGYSLWYFKGDFLEHRFDPTEKPLPSAYMPPGYVFVLLPFELIGNDPLRNSLLGLAQILFSILTIVVLWIFTRKYFSEQSAMVAALVASVLPDFAYSVVSTTPTILFQLTFLGLLWLLYKSQEQTTVRMVVSMGLLSSFIVYLRSEFLLFVVAISVFLLLKRKTRDTAVLLSTILLCLLPWIVRNYGVFHEFIPTTTSVGLNFFRGNNELGIGAWGDAQTANEITRLPRNDNFEVFSNRMYLKHAEKFIKDHPAAVLSGWLQKASDLWLVNVHDPTGRSANLVQDLFSLILFVLFVVGLRKSWSGRHLYSYLFLGCWTLTAMVFFVLPRYQTMMRIAVLPFAGYGIEVLWRKLRKSKVA